jgi:hypothetical protein
MATFSPEIEQTFYKKGEQCLLQHQTQCSPFSSILRTTPPPTAPPATPTSRPPTSSSSPLAPTRLPVTPTSRPPPPTPSPSTSKFARLDKRRGAGDCQPQRPPLSVDFKHTKNSKKNWVSAGAVCVVQFRKTSHVRLDILVCFTSRNIICPLFVMALTYYQRGVRHVVCSHSQRLHERVRICLRRHRTLRNRLTVNATARF